MSIGLDNGSNGIESVSSSDALHAVKRKPAERPNSARKRLRPSESTDYDSLEQESDVQLPLSPASTQTSQVEINLDIDHEPQSSQINEDAYDKELSHSIQASLIPKQEKGYAEHGVVEKISLRNFMCHSLLEVELGPNINFIVGHNGSGKSAILTALTVCFGAKANVTNRGTSVKSLIKEGCHTASVVVTLKNEGVDAFKSDVYGARITIERTFSKDSPGGYKLKNAAEKLVSKRREDLDEICDHMGIQVNNPLTILNQDVAKQFLGNSSPREKYDLFMQGVQLEQLRRDYALIEETVNAATFRLSNQRENLERLGEVAQEATERFRETERARDMHNQLEHLKDEMAWAQVKEKQTYLEEAEAQVAREERKLKEIEEKLLDSGRAVTDIETTLHDHEENYSTTIRSEKQPFTAKLEQIEKNKADLSKEIQELNAQEREIDQNLKETLEQLRKNENDLQEQYQKTASETGEGRSNLQVSIGAKEDEIKLVGDKISNGNGQRTSIGAARERLLSDVKSKTKERDQVYGEIRDVKQLVQNLKSSRANKLAAFGQNVAALVSEIERNKSVFHQKPIGPLGLFMQLRDQRWSSILEVFFGNTLNSFLVENHEDKQQLQRIMQRAGCDCIVNVFGNDPFDYSMGEPSPEFDTVLRMLTFSDERVKRFLIVRHTVESTVLIADRAKADEVMYNSPHNITSCYALDAEGRGGFRVGGSRGSSSTVPVEPWRGASRLSKTVESEIKYHEQNLVNFNNRLKSIELDLHEIRRQITGLETDEKKLKSELASWHSDVARLRNELEDLKDQLESGPRLNVRIASLQDTRQELEEARSYDQGQLDDVVKANDKAKRKMAQLTQEKEEVERSLADIDRQMECAFKKIDELKDQAYNAKRHVNHWKEQREKHRRLKDDYERNVRESQSVYKRALSIAKEICDEVPVHHSAAQLDRQISNLAKRVEDAQDRLGSTVEQIAIEMQTSCSKFEDAKVSFIALEKILQLLHKTLSHRQKRWLEFRVLITMRTKSLFQFNLNQRGFNGRLVVKHKERTLEPVVSYFK